MSFHAMLRQESMTIVKVLILTSLTVVMSRLVLSWSGVDVSGEEKGSGVYD